MQKKLTLVHPDEDSNMREFILGREGVTGITRADGGYAVERGASREVFPDARVAKYWEERRPGVTPEPEDDTSRFGTRSDEDDWTCKLCGKGGYKTFQALKIHHGRSHQ